MGWICDAARAGFMVNDRRLLAMAGYMQMLAAWAPEQIEAPTGFLRARDGLLTTEDAAEPWRLPHVEREVEGDHLTMMIDHLEDTAAAVLAVLEELCPGMGDPEALAGKERI